MKNSVMALHFIFEQKKVINQRKLSSGRRVELKGEGCVRSGVKCCLRHCRAVEWVLFSLL